MKNFIRLKKSRGVRLAAFGMTVTVAVIAAAIMAGPGIAASSKLTDSVLRVNGTDASDKIALRLEAGNPAIVQVDIGDDGSADFSFERAEIAEIAVNGGAGDDLVRIDEINGAVNADIPTTLRGGDGNDTLAGGSGAERLRGGDGSDSLDGNRGADAGLMGDGADTFVWDPGDGSDVVEGQGGADTMLFNGAPIAEQ